MLNKFINLKLDFNYYINKIFLNNFHLEFFQIMLKKLFIHYQVMLNQKFQLELFQVMLNKSINLKLDFIIYN